jgi:phosphoribosylformylglycinamidine synthase subunit PurQ / glutaminase
MKVAVVRFPGSNCDLDAVHALGMFPRLEPHLVWHEDAEVGSYDAVILPGGFSFGDCLRSGAIAAKSPAISRIRRMADRGRPVLGICNGFQILVEAGLLPGALLRNTTLKFVCKWITVRVENTSTVFTRLMTKGQVIRMPIAHNEGRYYDTEAELKRISREGLVVFRYCSEDGEVDSSSNPTGTLANIAGICNKEGNVVGLMPHPERAAESILSPLGSQDGRLFFESMLAVSS